MASSHGRNCGVFGGNSPAMLFVTAVGKPTAVFSIDSETYSRIESINPFSLPNAFVNNGLEAFDRLCKDS